MRSVLWLAGLLILAACSGQAFAQARGPLTNVYASWVSVAATATTTVTFPYNSRDVIIKNGTASTPVCINLKGGAITATGAAGLGECKSTTDSYVTQLAGADELVLYDYVTNAVSFRALGVTTASPIGVVVTY